MLRFNLFNNLYDNFRKNIKKKYQSFRNIFNSVNNQANQIINNATLYDVENNIPYINNLIKLGFEKDFMIDDDQNVINNPSQRDFRHFLLDCLNNQITITDSNDGIDKFIKNEVFKEKNKQLNKIFPENKEMNIFEKIKELDLKNKLEVT